MHRLACRLLASHLTRTRHDGRSRAFTLIELIVAIVVLGLLAALAVPALNAVVDRSHDEAARIELLALHREAAALAALDSGQISTAELSDATADTGQAAGLLAQEATSKLALADGTADGDTPDGTPDPTQPSRQYGQVSFDTNSAGQVELAMVSRAGHCALLAGGATDAVAEVDRGVDVDGGGCVADLEDSLGPDPAGDGDGDGGGSDDGVSDPIAQPLPESWRPDPATPIDTVHEHDDTGATEIEQDGGPTGAFAIASFPSTHTSPPHTMYVSFPDAGLVAAVTDTGTGAVLRQTATSFSAPTGMAAGPAPGSTSSTFTHLYVADASAGTVTAWDPEAATTATVATGLDAPGSLLVGGCHDTAGATVGGTCVTVATDAGLVQAPTDGTTPRTVSTDASVTATAGLAPLPGSPATVAVADGTGITTVAMDGTVGALTDAPSGTTSLGWDGAAGTLLAGHPGTLSALDPATGTPTTLTGDIGSPAAVHFHGNAGIHYAADASCLYRVQSSTATQLWCGGQVDDVLISTNSTTLPPLPDNTVEVDVTASGDVFAMTPADVMHVTADGTATAVYTTSNGRDPFSMTTSGDLVVFTTGCSYSGCNNSQLRVYDTAAATLTTADGYSGSLAHRTVEAVDGGDVLVHYRPSGSTVRRWTPGTDFALAPTVLSSTEPPLDHSMTAVASTLYWVQNHSGTHKLHATDVDDPATIQTIADVPVGPTGGATTDGRRSLAVTGGHAYTVDRGGTVVHRADLADGTVAAVAGTGFQNMAYTSSSTSGSGAGAGPLALMGAISDLWTAPDGTLHAIARHGASPRPYALTEGTWSWVDGVGAPALDPATVTAAAHAAPAGTTGVTAEDGHGVLVGVADALYRLDPTTGDYTLASGVGLYGSSEGPYELTMAGGVAYFNGRYSSSYRATYVANPATGAHKRSVPRSGTLLALPDGRLLTVTGGNTIVARDWGSTTNQTWLALPSSWYVYTMGRSGDTVYAYARDDASEYHLLAIPMADPTSWTSLGQRAVDGFSVYHLGGLVADAAGDLYYLGGGQKTVRRFDPDTRTETIVIGDPSSNYGPLGYNATQLAADSSRMYVTSSKGVVVLTP